MPEELPVVQRRVPGAGTGTSGEVSAPSFARTVIEGLWRGTVRPNDTATVSFDSRLGALWTIVIALDFFWMSNPIVFWNFTDSLRNACAVTLGALLLTPLRRMPRVPWTIVAVLTFVFLTILWSVFSRFTVHVAFLYLAIAVVGLAIAVAVDGRTIAHGMLLGGVLIVVGSVYAYEIELPGSAAAPGEGFLAGVGTNRNILSYTLILALPFAFSFIPRTWVGRALWLVGTGTVLAGLYLTQSATGLVAAVAILGMAVVMGWRDRAVARRPDPTEPVSWWFRIAPAAVLGLAAAVLVALVQIRDREDGIPTLTGRTPIWSATWKSVDGWDRWVGNGWGMVWQHPWFPAGPNELHTEIVRRTGFDAVHGHNSFFDLLPEAGLVGVLLFAAAYGQAIARGLYLRRIDTAPDAAQLATGRAALLGVLALVSYGITEPLATIPIGWWLLVILAAGLPARARRLVEPADQPTGRPSGKRTSR